MGAIITLGLNYTPSLMLTLGYGSGEESESPTQFLFISTVEGTLAIAVG